MINIASIIKYWLDGVARGDTRFTVVDDEHVVDTKTGVKLCMYDDWFKFVGADGVTLATRGDFTVVEQELVWRLKQSLLSAEEREAKSAGWPAAMKMRREGLSNAFENPPPVDDGVPYAG